MKFDNILAAAAAITSASPIIIVDSLNNCSLTDEKQIEIIRKAERDAARRYNQQVDYHKANYARNAKTHALKRTKKGVGRNSPCECGSGKKSKHCCRNKEYK